MSDRIKNLLRPGLLAIRYWRNRIRPNRSYADDLEDVAASLLLDRIERFVDVGANDGISCSNTALAAMQGAKGLCFEPNPADYRRLRGFYRCAPRIACICEGLSDQRKTVELRTDGLLSAITATEDTALTNLLAEFHHPDAKIISVQVDRLSAWLDRRPEFQSGDLLSIDVEGHELSVLRGIDWARHPKPARCLIIETHADSATRQWRHRDFAEIDALLVNHGYRRLAASRNNTFWLHREDLLDSRIAVAKQRLTHYEWFSDDHARTP